MVEFSTVSTPLYGKLSDIFGRRPLFIIAEVRRHPVNLDARQSDEAAAAATSTEPHEGLRVTG